MMFKTTKICMKGTKEILRETKKEKITIIFCVYTTLPKVCNNYILLMFL